MSFSRLKKEWGKTRERMRNSDSHVTGFVVKENKSLSLFKLNFNS